MLEDLKYHQLHAFHILLMDLQCQMEIIDSENQDLRERRKPSIHKNTKILRVSCCMWLKVFSLTQIDIAVSKNSLFWYYICSFSLTIWLFITLFFCGISLVSWIVHFIPHQKQTLYHLGCHLATISKYVKKLMVLCFPSTQLHWNNCIILVSHQ